MLLRRVAAAAINQTPLDWQRNLQNVRAAIEAAKSRDVSLLCLPEMCITGYGCEDAFFSSAVQRTALDLLEKLLPETVGIVVSVGLPLRVNKALFNTACLIANGKIIGFTAKQHLAGEGIHYEHRWFRPWPAGERYTVEVAGEEYPVGDLCYDIGGVKIGFEICEDAWVARRPGADLAHLGVDVILNPSASHFAFGKRNIREQFVIEGSRAFACHYAYANLLGNEAGRAIYDGGTLIASNGKLLAAGKRLSFEDVIVADAVIDLDAVRTDQSTRGGYVPDFSGDPKLPQLVRCDFDWPDCEPAAAKIDRPAWESSPAHKEEEFARAVSLGLFDYMRKSRSRGFVVSLSGGADSAATACLVRLAAALPSAELGREGLLAKLEYFNELQNCESVDEMMRSLLTTAYQSTRNSSNETKSAAAAVAGAIYSTHYELDVDSLVTGYREMISNAVGRELNWKDDDITLQNIQARVRGPGVWMLANLRSALLLATSNRSEAAVGYTTMDGDTCGGLSPIAGIDKAFLRLWLAWLQTDGPAEIGPIPELEVITRLAPTAELRPASAKQTDEDDLMPYDLLDAIERAAIRDKQSPSEVLRQMRVMFPDRFADADLRTYVVRFFRLWCRNQWKRERYAPSFHLDDENLDPKTWCRFPILSGGYREELARIEAGR